MLTICRLLLRIKAFLPVFLLLSPLEIIKSLLLKNHYWHCSFTKFYSVSSEVSGLLQSQETPLRNKNEPREFSNSNDRKSRSSDIPHFHPASCCRGLFAPCSQARLPNPSKLDLICLSATEFVPSVFFCFCCASLQTGAIDREPAMSCLCSVLRSRVIFPNLHILAVKQTSKAATVRFSEACNSPWSAPCCPYQGCVCTGASQHFHCHSRRHPTSPRPLTGMSQFEGLCGHHAEETQPVTGFRVEPATTTFDTGENPMAHEHILCKAATSSLISQVCSSRKTCKYFWKIGLGMKIRSNNEKKVVVTEMVHLCLVL